jgi:hypothetical protein
LYVRGHVNNTLAYILVDTGSQISVISEQFYNLINKRTPVAIRKCNGEISGITNDIASVKGVCKLPIQLVNCNANANRKDVILHHDFM